MLEPVPRRVALGQLREHDQGGFSIAFGEQLVGPALLEIGRTPGQESKQQGKQDQLWQNG
ncbi:hypothetical protein D3C86_2195860 [compost metagenome]